MSSNRLTRTTLALLLAFCLTGCEDGNDVTGGELPSPAQQLLAQFGDAAPLFSLAGIQSLLDWEDPGSPVTLLQLYSVKDEQLFARYEASLEAAWQQAGAQPRFTSRTFGQLVGMRPLGEVRAFTLPNAGMLLQALDSGEFVAAMNMLAASVDDTAWVLGVEENLPAPPTAAYVDPALQNLDPDTVSMLVGAADNESAFESSLPVISQMLLSDDPSPFWMVNLIDFFAQANYPDGRETDLTGIEVNAIYGQSIVPTLLAYNSFPELVMPVAVALTMEPAAWEQAAVVRYASRDAFLNAFPLNPHVRDSLIHKEAAVENTLVYATEVETQSLPTPTTGPFYNLRYCEVLLGTVVAEGVRADVYNSIPFSTCPQEAWDALNALDIAQANGADFAILNGIRFWVLDRISVIAPPTDLPPPEQVLENFGGITMRLAASVTIPALDGSGEAAYRVAQVSRNTVFTYVAGRQVYELIDPQGERYIMQSFSRVEDRDQQLEELQRLGQRLELPAGWQFVTRVLQEDFQLRTVEGIARVISDDLNNVYQHVPE